MRSDSHVWMTNARRRLKTIRSLRRGFRNWPRFSVGLVLRRFGLSSSPVVAITRKGTTFSSPGGRTAPSVFVEVYAEDEYNLRGLRLGPEDVVVDIGAHIGVFTLAVHELYPTARIYAYEPSAVSFDYLKRNVTDNQASDHVSIFNVAVTAKGGPIRFFDDDSATTGASSHVPRLGTRQTVVESVAFDDLVATCARRIDVLKIDCEGGEYDIFLNSSDRSWSSVQRLLFEYHPVAGHSWEELRARLQDLGFTLMSHRPMGDNWGLAEYGRASA